MMNLYPFLCKLQDRVGNLSWYFWGKSSHYLMLPTYNHLAN